MNEHGLWRAKRSGWYFLHEALSKNGSWFLFSNMDGLPYSLLLFLLISLFPVPHNLLMIINMRTFLGGYPLGEFCT